jgi:cytidylate kinase
MHLAVGTDPGAPYVRVGGTDVTGAIRDVRISATVSIVATNLEVRAELRARQRAIIDAAAGGIVAEGRDITTVVAPDADVRVLLTASEQARLARRALELHGTQDDLAIQATRDLVVRRDADDSTVSSFLTAADGVLALDSSGLTFEQTVQAVLDVIAASSPSFDLVATTADASAGTST